jgi:type IV pilus assembly protein PilA
MFKSFRKQEGFTLIELMIVVAIIGILAAIAIPNFLTYQLKSRQSEARTNLGGIRSGQTSHNGLFACYLSIAPTGAGVPAAGTKATPVAWVPPVATVIPVGQTWCQAAGPGSVGNFTDLGFAATGNVFFSYSVDTLAAPVAPAVTAACLAGGQALATGANGAAPAPGAYQATAGANLDGDGNWSDFGVSDSVSVTMCSSPSMY